MILFAIIMATSCQNRIYRQDGTGEIWFTDKDGNMILQEQKGGGKYFEPIEVEGTSGYTFRQIFESPDDEAFYGLGQHQSDEFNYKGKNEELFQYNTKVSVPFIVSNKGYGVLMDSYSMIGFTYDDAAGKLKIAERKGEFPGMLKERIFNVIKVSKQGRSKPVKVVYDGKETVVTFN